MASRSKRVTYYIVQSFTGPASPPLSDPPVGPLHSEGVARRTFDRLKDRKAGVVLFSRTGDATLGEFDDAVVLDSHGEVPLDLQELAA